MKDEILIKFLLKETTEEENTEVKKWLSSNVDHKTYFLQFEKIWSGAKKLAIKSNLNEEQAWLNFKEKTKRASSDQTKTYPIKTLPAWLMIAAVFILVSGIWFAYNLLSAPVYISVAAGNQVHIQKLPDGSEITLNKNTELSYAADFSDDRSIQLKKGDVFFNVAHDKKRPFVIDMDKISVQVVGTSFNIKRNDNETEIIVETGIVKVTLQNEILELHTGEKVQISAGTTQLVGQKNSDLLYNYYRSKLFIANNIPLGQLVTALNEAYNCKIIISDSNVANETIVTTLKQSNTLDYNLLQICDAMNLKITRNQDQIILSRSQ